MAAETLRVCFPDMPNPPASKLTYGLPFYEACAKHVTNTYRAQRAYIIASKTLSEKTNFLQQLKEALGSRLIGTWIGIASHTPANALIPIINDIRSKQADCLITLGGGSISDGAKLINLAVANNVDTLDGLYQLPRVGAEMAAATGRAAEAPKMPLICIPISLSGGEYTKYAGVTNPETRFKDQFVHDHMLPSLVILDPALTVGTPMTVWLSSGVRSIDHCVEGFLSVDATPEGDAAAKRGLKELVIGLLKTVDEPDDLDARLSCQLGCNLSMTLLALGIRKGASHGVGHQLGSMGVAHGDTSCIMLPAVCKYNASVNREKQEELKMLLLQQKPVQKLLRVGPQGLKVSDLGDVLRAIFDALGRPKSLRDVDFAEGHLEALAKNCLQEVYVRSNPRAIKTTSDVMELLSMVQG